jgi:hypothetical protein
MLHGDSLSYSDHNDLFWFFFTEFIVLYTLLIKQNKVKNCINF